MVDVIKFDKSRGYKNATYEGKWNGYDVYRPDTDIKNAKIGFPLMIMVKGDIIRMTTPEESLQYLDDTQ